MPRKGFDNLSPAYRARLEKNGISRKDYESGASIKAARGHKATPERPTQAANFPNYNKERQSLVTRITTNKQHWFGTSPKWNPTRAAKVFKDRPPAMAKLRFWAKLTREEWLDAIREEPNILAYLGYH